LAHIAIVSGTPTIEIAAESNTEQTNAHGGATDLIDASYNYFTQSDSGPVNIGSIHTAGYQFLSDHYFGSTDLFADGQFNAEAETFDANGNLVPINVTASFSGVQSITLQVTPDSPGETGLPVDILLRASLSTSSDVAGEGSLHPVFLSRLDYTLPGQPPVQFDGVTHNDASLGEFSDSKTLHLQVGDTFTIDLEVSANLAETTSGGSFLAGLELNASIAPSVTPTTPTFDVTNGGVDYGYTIDSADLPQATTVDLYWASGTTADTELGSPIMSTTTVTAHGTYQLQALASALSVPPAGAKDLVVVVDPGNVISPADSSKVASLALADISEQPADLTQNQPDETASLMGTSAVDITNVTLPGSDGADGPVRFTPKFALPTPGHPIQLGAGQPLQFDVRLVPNFAKSIHLKNYESHIVYDTVQVTTDDPLHPRISVPVFVFLDLVDQNSGDGKVTFNKTVYTGSPLVHRDSTLIFDNLTKKPVDATLSLAGGVSSSFSIDSKSVENLYSVPGSDAKPKSMVLSFDPASVGSAPTLLSDSLGVTIAGIKFKVALEGTSVPPANANLDFSGFTVAAFQKFLRIVPGLDRSGVEPQQGLQQLETLILQDVRHQYLGFGAAIRINAGSGLYGETLSFVDQTDNHGDYGLAAYVDYKKTDQADDSQVPTPSRLFSDQNRFNSNPSGTAQVYLKQFYNDMAKAVGSGSLTKGEITLSSLAHALANTAAHELAHLLGVDHGAGQNDPSNLITQGDIFKGNFAARFRQARDFYGHNEPVPGLAVDIIKVGLKIPVAPNIAKEAARFPAILRIYKGKVYNPA